MDINIIKCGETSSSVTLPHLFIKYIVKYKKFDVYKREKHIASILKKFSWYPPLLYSDDEEQFLIFKKRGVPLNSQNAPDDLIEQFNKILDDMKSVNVQHNDIKPGEILVDDQKIYLCDFGWGSINNDLGCGIGIWSCNNKKKPGGYHDDSFALKRLNLI